MGSATCTPVKLPHGAESCLPHSKPCRASGNGWCGVTAALRWAAAAAGLVARRAAAAALRAYSTARPASTEPAKASTQPAPAAPLRPPASCAPAALQQQHGATTTAGQRPQEAQRLPGGAVVQRVALRQAEAAGERPGVGCSSIGAAGAGGLARSARVGGQPPPPPPLNAHPPPRCCDAACRSAPALPSGSSPPTTPRSCPPTRCRAATSSGCHSLGGGSWEVAPPPPCRRHSQVPHLQSASAALPCLPLLPGTCAWGTARGTRRR